MTSKGADTPIMDAASDKAEQSYPVDLGAQAAFVYDAGCQIERELIATRQALEIAFKYVPGHKIQEVKAPLIPFDFPDKEVT